MKLHRKLHRKIALPGFCRKPLWCPPFFYFSFIVPTHPLTFITSTLPMGFPHWLSHIKTDCHLRQGEPGRSQYSYSMIAFNRERHCSAEAWHRCCVRVTFLWLRKVKNSPWNQCSKVFLLSSQPRWDEMKILLPVTSAKIWPESGMLTVNIAEKRQTFRV